MKLKTYALLAAAAACGLASAAETAYTTPVGYDTQVLKPNQFTLAGLSLQNPAVAAGILDGATSSSVTDNEMDFSAVLSGGKIYILELTNGSSDGVIQEVSTWSGSSLTTPADISTSVTPGTTTYTLRESATVSSVFGAANSVGLTPTPDGDPTVADKLLIPNATNGFDTVFYFNDGAGTEGWLDGDGNLAADKVMPYPDGFYVQRGAGSDLNLVVSGEVKLTKTSGVLLAGFNYLNGISPVGVSLDASGINDFISQSADGDATTVDNVLLPTATGGYTTCFYFNDGAGTEGWLDSEGNLAGGYLVEDGFLILNRGGVKPYTVNVPSAFSSL